MKKAAYALIIIFVIGLIIFASLGNDNDNKADTHTDFIRIHIRANSNSDKDQSVKYAVKEDVVAFLTPLIAECGTREDVISVIGKNITGVSKAAAARLKKEGFSYGARADFSEEYFPARDYDGLTLESGFYDAVILYLGEGTGDNWWCVVYPPLCFVNTEFTGGEGVRYKSKIAELIKKYFG